MIGRVLIGTLRFCQSRSFYRTPSMAMAGQLKLTRRLMPYTHLLRMMKYEGSVDVSGGRSQVVLPGLAPDDFDRTGNLSVWRLQRILTMCRFFVYHWKNEETGCSFLEYDTLTQDKYTFMASTKTDVDLDFYRIADHQKLPSLAVNIHLGYVGSASLNSVAELVDLDSGKVFATNTNQVVMVDKTTRKPSVLPDWWKDRYKKHVIGNVALVVPLIPAPENDRCHTYDMKVSWNDIDSYKHTNYISYIRFCFDAAMDATVKGHFSKLHDDILGYHAKKMEISYKGESLAGDLLRIKCWENMDNPLLIHFDISRDGLTIFQNAIEFHEPEEPHI